MGNHRRRWHQNWLAMANKLTFTSVKVVLSSITWGSEMYVLPLERCKSLNGMLIHPDLGTSLRFHSPGCSITL